MKTTRNLFMMGLLAVAFSCSADLSIAAEPAAQPDAKPPKEGASLFSGEILKLTVDSIEIKDHKGELQTLAITPETKFGPRLHAAKREDFKVGQHVSVTYAKADGKMKALVVREMPAREHAKDK